MKAQKYGTASPEQAISAQSCKVNVTRLHRNPDDTNAAFVDLVPARPIVTLIGSNVFMTTAWYGHLRFKEVPLFGVIVASWLIAFVGILPCGSANRFGSAFHSTAQLKTIQEVITLVVFAASQSRICVSR